MKTLIILLAAVMPLAAVANIRMEQSITVLVTNEGLLGGGRGSGVLIDPTHVLTCAHMAKSPSDEFFIYTYPLGAVIKGEVEAADIYHDLLIIKLAQPVAVARFAQFEHHYMEGDPITVVGNALGSMSWLVSKGVISGTQRNFLLTDASIHPGNSGGPWFNEDGDIVALTDWGLNGVEGISGGISAETIEYFLAKWKAN
jgi:S1-C subfamily serine protease